MVNKIANPVNSKRKIVSLIFLVAFVIYVPGSLLFTLFARYFLLERIGVCTTARVTDDYAIQKGTDTRIYYFKYNETEYEGKLGKSETKVNTNSCCIVFLSFYPSISAPVLSYESVNCKCNN